MNSVNQFSNNCCYGCGVCVVTCPKKAVSMKLNEDGFYLPVVDESRCVLCGLCLQTCAFNDQNLIQQASYRHYYSAWSLSEEIRKTTTSGGVVFDIACFLLDKGYKVCAVRYDIVKHRAEHYISSNVGDLEESKGSKYMQSYTSSAFQHINKTDSFVIVGTPCQIDSLRRLIKLWGVEEHFVLIDFFCHGTPSMNLWKSYLDYTNILDIEDVKFRSKTDGWQENTYYIIIKGKSKTWRSKLIEGDLFYKFFLGDRCLNKACYNNCKYKTINSSADIRVGDMWGQKYKNNQEGVSAVITFTKQGDDIIRHLSSCCVTEETLSNVLGTQMRCNAQKPLSYGYVKKALKRNNPLNKISAIASFLEIPVVFSRRIKYYLKRLIGK